MASLTIDNLTATLENIPASVNLIKILDDGFNIDNLTLQKFCEVLPNDFEFHFYGKPLHEIQVYLLNSLIDLPHDSADIQIISSELFSLVSRVLHFLKKKSPPLFFSLRKVTPDYILKHSPSVSDCFHRDGACYTFTRTFYGPGVEWVDNKFIDRDYFRKHSIQRFNGDDSAFKEKNIPYNQVGENESIILKGETYEGIDSRTVDFISHFIGMNSVPNFNQDNGLIHRGSSETSIDFRVVLTINIFEP